MANLTINNVNMTVPDGITILEAAKMNNIKIPTFCYLENVQKMGSCRICVVEVEGQRNLMASCMVEVRDGMKINTNSERVRTARKNIYKLILSDHPKDCLRCVRNQKCELQQLEEMIQLDERELIGERSKKVVDKGNPSVVRDNSKCVLCRRCVTACNEIQGLGIINLQNRGFKSIISTTADLPLNEISCTYCGQCTVVCPVGALNEKDAIADVWKALSDKSKRVVIQTAPAVRVALGEEFGYPPGTIVTGKMAAAMKRLGFHDIFDTNFAADLTILEEGNEFLHRVKDMLAGDKTA
ncbi:MAG TPA: [Fe-Fe] hydrogenase large subunit C-terminal domain-containing protein, partial [Spirochaetota bacterium]|nr:[Fe-Fe] hydrogenase large subunit C-terminal domain-containing protein [Spirochaetota bacterium]